MKTQKILRLYCISYLHFIGNADKIEWLSEFGYYLARKLAYWELNDFTVDCLNTPHYLITDLYILLQLALELTDLLLAQLVTTR